MTIKVAVIASTGHGKNPLQKRVMTIKVAVIASGAKQSRLSRLYLDCFCFFRSEKEESFNDVVPNSLILTSLDFLYLQNFRIRNDDTP